MGSWIAKIFWAPVVLLKIILLSISVRLYIHKKRRHIAANPPRYGGERPAYELGEAIKLLADYVKADTVERICEAPSGLSFLGLYRIVGESCTVYVIRNREGELQVEGTSMFLVNYCNFLRFWLRNPPPEGVKDKLRLIASLA